MSAPHASAEERRSVAGYDEIPEVDLTAIRDATNGGFVLGSDRFQRQIAQMVGRRTWRGESGRPRKQAPDDDQLNLPI